MVYRWYTDPASRRLYPDEDHDLHGRVFTSQLRAAVTRDGAGSRAAENAQALLERSAEFAARWSEHEIGVRLTDQRKRLNHPELGLMELHCQILLDPDQSQSLLVYTAAPGTESYEKLQLLHVIGAQRFPSGPQTPA
jgi:hypothetical protein